MLRACEDEVEKSGEAGGGVGIQLRRKRPFAASCVRLARRGFLFIVMIEDNLGIEQEKVEHN